MLQVLIVEDDPMVAKINQDYIERVEGFCVKGIAGNGEKALKYLEVHRQIDLIILDVYMPKMDGITMLEDIRKEFHDVDVIFVTAAKEKKVIQRGLQLGAVDYLIKPFTFERIRQALETYKERHALIHGSEGMSQKKLDLLFRGPEKNSLPKGIHPLTLEKIQAWIKNQEGEEVDQRGMTRQLSISIVTLRLYLDYLEEIGMLQKESRYGGIGRPSYVYKVRFWSKG